MPPLLAMIHPLVDACSASVLVAGGCSEGGGAMALSQTGVLTETPFCIRQLEQEPIIKEMIG